ncbi:MAG TPA: MFS transporter [Anaeromyxobacteraceae bacterium]|nr:MFS transporter [Anaeromyxobacteraceae bacterium]
MSLPPPRRVGPALIVLAYVAFVSLGLPDTVLGIAWPSLRARFGLSQQALGAVLATAVAGYATSSALASRLAPRLGVGGLLALSTALVSLGLLGYALATAWGLFVPWAAVIGLGSGAIDAALNSFAAHHLPARHMNWLHACYSLGATIGPAMMTSILAAGASYRAGYGVLSAALAAMALTFFSTRARWDDDGPVAAGALDGERSHALARPRVWLQVSIFFVYTGIELGTGAWAFSALREVRGLEVAAAGAWTTAYYGSILSGRVLVGFVVDRVGPDRLLRLATVGAVAGALLFSFAPGVTGQVGLLVLGLSLAPMFPTLMARTPARVGADVASESIGYQVSAATIGSAVLPSAFGFVAERAGLATLGAALLLATGLLLLLHEVLLRSSRRAGGGPGSPA